MSLYHREEQYIQILGEGGRTVRELAEKLFISQPTVRRDITQMKMKEIVLCKRGFVTLAAKSPDKRIPLFIRDSENKEAKIAIARKALKHVKDGDAIMLDASTTAFHLLPYLAELRNILVITNGVKTVLEAAALGIRAICTGGEMTQESYSFVGTDAETTLRKYNADVAFFSCRGLDEEGLVTDNSIRENAMRTIMMQRARKVYLLCDRSKLGRRCLHTLCTTDNLNGVITE